MRVYTVHRRSGAIASSNGADVVFVPEAFSWSALILGPFWLAAVRAWMAMAIWILASAMLLGAALWWGLSPEMIGAAGLVIAILTALEAQDLRRRALEKRGFRMVDVAAGDSLDAAERAYFRRAAPVAPPAPAWAGSAATRAPIGGLFGDFGD